MFICYIYKSPILYKTKQLMFTYVHVVSTLSTHTHTTGELFDHGLDSWAAILLPMCLMSAFGRGQPWGGTVYDAFGPCLAALAGFYLSHWEKYITGVLYLPWLYDIIWLVSGSCMYMWIYMYALPYVLNNRGVILNLQNIHCLL